MKLKNIIIGTAIAVSSLFALDDVGTISSSSHTIGGTTSSNPNITFSWTKPAGAVKYCYILDTNSSADVAYVLNNTYPNCGDNPAHVSLSSGDTTTITHTPSITSDGYYYFHIVALDDTTSSASKTTTGAISIDVTPGIVNMTAGGSFSGKKSVTLTSTETGTLYYTVNGDEVNTSSPLFVTDNSANPTVTLSLTVSATVKTLLKDTAGNVQATASSATYSTTNSSPTLSKSDDSVNVSGQTIATDTTTNLKVSNDIYTRYKYKKDGGSWITVNSIDTSISISALESGQYTYYVLGGDAYNFQTEFSTVSFTVDNNTVPKGLSIKANGVEVDETNTSTYTFGDNFRVELNTTDGSSVDSIYYTVDGSTPSSSSSAYTVAFDTTFTLQPNAITQKTLRMIAYNSSNNPSSEKSIVFKIDKEAPVVTMPPTSDFAVNFTVTFSSNDSGAKLYYKESNVSTIDEPNEYMTGWTESSSALISSGADSNLRVIAIDEFGNRSTIPEVTFTYKTKISILSTVASLDIGTVEATAVISDIVKITNSGDLNVTIDNDNLSIAGTNFSIASNPDCGVLTSGETCDINISFSSADKGVKTDTLTISYGDTNSSTLSIALSAERVDVAPVIESIPDLRIKLDSNKTSYNIGDVNATDADGDTISFSATSSNEAIATADINTTTGALTLTTVNSATGSAIVTVNVITADATVTKGFAVIVYKEEREYLVDSSTILDTDTNVKTTTFSGASVELKEYSDGKVMASDGVNSLNVNVSGSSIVIDAEGTLSTSLQNTLSVSSLAVDINGVTTNSVVVGDVTTKIESSVETNSTIESNGNVTSQFTIQNIVMELVVSAEDGVLTPNLPSTVVIPDTLPVGTKATVGSDSIKFEFALPATLTFN